MIQALGVALSLAWAGQSIPPPPAQYLLDEPRVIDAKSAEWISRTLSEHQRLTGEQVVVAVFNELNGEEPVDYTNRVFTEWKIGKKAKNNGVLLALYWKEHKSRIEVGYGLEPLLTDLKSGLILRNILAPRLKQGEPGAALSAAVWEILKTVESPLIQAKQPSELPFSEEMEDRSGHARAIMFLLFGIGTVLWIIFRLVSPEIHYTSQGWYRRGFGGMGGGGIFGGGGSGGSGGGFLGGGGMSGGGGASGDW